MYIRFFELLFPRRCVGCRCWGEYLCAKCWRKLSFLPYQYCPYCNRPSPGGRTHRPLCTHLPNGRPRRQHLDGALAAVQYNRLARKLISQFKYFPQTQELEQEIRKIFTRFFTPEEEFFSYQTIITAVPLHWTRYNQRGFNQAEIIAQILAELWQLRSNFSLLVRYRHTAQQTNFNRTERFHNVRGAFRATFSSHLAREQLRRIVLVDDVWTTGATLKECARVLKQRGVAQVWAVTLARD